MCQVYRRYSPKELEELIKELKGERSKEPKVLKVTEKPENRFEDRKFNEIRNTPRVVF